MYFHYQKKVVGKSVFSILSIERKCWRFTMVFLWDESHSNDCTVCDAQFAGRGSCFSTRRWETSDGRKGPDYIVDMTASVNSVSEVHENSSRTVQRNCKYDGLLIWILSVCTLSLVVCNCVVCLHKLRDTRCFCSIVLRSYKRFRLSCRRCDVSLSRVCFYFYKSHNSEKSKAL